MVALVVVVIHEGLDLGLKIAGQEVVFQQDAVLQSLMPPLDLALGLGVIRRTAGVLHAFVLQPFGQLPRDVAGAVVAQQARLVGDVNLAASRRLLKPDPSVSVTSWVLMFVQSFHEMM